MHPVLTSFRAARPAVPCGRVWLAVLAAVTLGAAAAAPAAAQAAKVAPRVSAFTPRDTSVAGLRRAIDSLRALGAGGSGRATATDAVLAAAYRRLAGVLRYTDPAASVVEYRLAMRLATLVRDSALLSDVTYSLGIVHWVRNDYDSALVHLEQARRLRTVLGDSVGLGQVLNSLGATYYQLANYEPALNAFMASLARRRLDGDAAATSRVLANIGKTYQDWGQYDRALPMALEAVATARTAGVPATLGYALNCLASLYTDLRDYPRARGLLQESEVAYSRGSLSDSTSGWSLNAAARAQLFLREGRPREAIVVLDSARAVGDAARTPRGEARVLLDLGQAYRALNEADRARGVLTRSVQLSSQVSQRVLTLQALQELADLEEAGGNSSAALKYLRRFQALRDTVFSQSTAQRLAAIESNAAVEREQAENERLRDAQVTQSLIIARQRLAGILGAIILVLVVALAVVLVRFNRRGREREAVLHITNDNLKAVTEEMRTALSEVRALKGLIPICASCKKVRDDQGYWESVESYISDRADVMFSHSICQSCGPQLYGELWNPTDTAETETPAP